MTISVRPIYNFDQISLEEASRILYEEVIPKCEASGVKLSYYGNHTGIGTLTTVEVYDKEKQEHKLFNVARIQKAFKGLDEIISKATVESVGSYGLKHVVERHQKEYITNGDCIAAMLMKGYEANFTSKSPDYETELYVNCEFKLQGQNN